MEQIKPGTRCECRDCNCFEWHKDVDEAMADWCPRDAVRIVEVAFDRDPNQRFTSHLVPMCAACADYHESKVAVRTSFQRRSRYRLTSARCSPSFGDSTPMPSWKGPNHGTL